MKDFKLFSNLKSPKGKIPSFSDIFSSLKHSRCLSAKQSPYENASISSKSKSKPKLSLFSCTSPKTKTTEKLDSKLKPKHKTSGTEKKKLKKPAKAQKSSKLVQINDRNSMVVAPRIYQNQIFTDVYDLQGNHDRIMEISQSLLETSQDDSVIVKGKLEILNNIHCDMNKLADERRLRPPENSYLEETKAPNDINQDLMKKLNELALVQRDDSEY
jgi:hypothetical protein